MDEELLRSMVRQRQDALLAEAASERLGRQARPQGHRGVALTAFRWWAGLMLGLRGAFRAVRDARPAAPGGPVREQ